MDKTEKEINDNADKYAYVLSWIDEAITARAPLRELIISTTLAYDGKIKSNSYLNMVNKYASDIKIPEKKKDFQEACKTMVSAESTIFNDAINDLVSMTMGGVGQFEFGPYDKYNEKNPDLLDRLSRFAEHMHYMNRTDVVVKQAIKQAALQGAGYMYLNPDDMTITLIDAYNMLRDPISHRTNKRRYIGYTQMESWSAIKNRITETDSGFMLKSINSADRYLSEVEMCFNGETDEKLVRESVDIFYKAKFEDYRNKKKKDPKTDNYKADDIEMSYLWDLKNKTFFQVVNRKFIVAAKRNPMKATVDSTYYNEKGELKKFAQTVEVSDPFIELPFEEAFHKTYPTTPGFMMLPLFEKLCVLKTVQDHNYSIVGPINFVGSAFDARKFSRAMNISGEIIEGSQGQFGIFNKTHDPTVLITAIADIERQIRRAFGIPEQSTGTPMAGDRATATEVQALSGTTMQRLNQLLANIEKAMSELTDKMFKYYLIWSKDEILSFTSEGQYKRISKNEMLGDMMIKAVPKTSIKLQQAAMSQKAMLFMQSFMQAPYIEPTKMVEILGPIAMSDTVTKMQFKSMLKKEYRTDLEKFDLMTDYDPLEREVQGMDESQIAALEQELARGGMLRMAPDPNAPVDATGQPMSPGAGQPGSNVPVGQDPYQAGIDANARAGM